MFKNYLTYNFALSFDRACRQSQTISDEVKTRLIESSEKFINHFSKSLYEEERKNESKYLFVALLCLRDCRQILRDASVEPKEILTVYEIVHQRVEQLCSETWDSLNREMGQPRKFG